MRVKFGALALAAVLAVTVLSLLPGPPASGQPAQIPPESTLPPTVPPTAPPSTDILVPGSTAVPEATVGDTPTSVRPEPVTAGEDGGNAGRTVWIAIIGLLVVAALILTLTVLYARHTKPVPRAGRRADESPDEDQFTPTAARSVFGDGGHDEQTFWWAED